MFTYSTLKTVLLIDNHFCSLAYYYLKGDTSQKVTFSVLVRIQLVSGVTTNSQTDFKKSHIPIRFFGENTGISRQTDSVRKIMWVYFFYIKALKHVLVDSRNPKYKNEPEKAVLE